MDERAAGCYAVIFTAEMHDDLTDYAGTAERIRALAAEQPGFLGVCSVMEESREITVSYWRTREDIAAWKQHPEHRRAQERGRKEWYRRYRVEVVRIERAYGHGT